MLCNFTRSSSQDLWVCSECGARAAKHINPPPIATCKLISSEYPSTVVLATNFGKAMLKYAKSGFKHVTTEEYKARLDICQKCDFYDKGRCTICGCVIIGKAWIASEDCPENKWPKIEELKDIEK